jgi:hypothetical protein
MRNRVLRALPWFVVFITLVAMSSHALAAESAEVQLYKQLKAFKLDGSAIKVQNLSLARDGFEMTFTGEFYFSEPAAGAVHGAVFLGQGRFRSEPKAPSEGESLKRFLNAPLVESTFTKAVLRFTDDSRQKITGEATSGATLAEAQRLATGLDEHLTRETGLNIPARLLLGIVNKENPGFFFAEFDGGSRGRFEFSGGRKARTSIAANGPKTPIELRLPEKPQKIRLDPDRWILTDKTTEKGN